MVEAALRGLALGVAWGVVARIWMRLISTAPEFSWSGTLMIIIAAGLAGLGLGLIHAAKTQGRTRWWMLAIIIVLPLFAGRGLPFLPSVLLGGLAFYPRAIAWRVLGGSAIAGSVALLVWFNSLDATTDFPVVVGYGGFVLLAVGLAAGGSGLYRTAVERAEVRPIGRRRRGSRGSWGWTRAAQPEPGTRRDGRAIRGRDREKHRGLARSRIHRTWPSGRT